MQAEGGVCVCFAESELKHLLSRTLYISQSDTLKHHYVYKYEKLHLF